MAGALAAFFGCPLGGSLFAMEVNSRFGIEYFEHTVGKSSLVNKDILQLHVLKLMQQLNSICKRPSLLVKFVSSYSVD